MSLKAFHIVFVSVSTLLAIFVAVWAFRQVQQAGGPASMVMLSLSGLGAVGLPIYGVWFLGKTQDVSFL